MILACLMDGFCETSDFVCFTRILVGDEGFNRTLTLDVSRTLNEVGGTTKKGIVLVIVEKSIYKADKRL